MFKKYLVTLIDEKGASLNDPITSLENVGHFGLIWSDLVDYLASQPVGVQNTVRTTLIKIDFKNGNVFDYLNFLADAMIRAVYK